MVGRSLAARDRQIAAAYREGRSSYELARDFSTAQSNIYRILKKEGLIAKPQVHNVVRHTESTFTEPYHVVHDGVRRFIMTPPANVAEQFRVVTLSDRYRKGRHEY